MKTFESLYESDKTFIIEKTRQYYQRFFKMEDFIMRLYFPVNEPHQLDESVEDELQKKIEDIKLDLQDRSNYILSEVKKAKAPGHYVNTENANYKIDEINILVDNYNSMAEMFRKTMNRFSIDANNIADKVNKCFESVEKKPPISLHKIKKFKNENS